MDAIDQQLLTRRIDRIEHKIDRLIEILTTPAVIIATDKPHSAEDTAKLRQAFRESHKPVIVDGGVRIERRAPVLQAEDFEDL